MLNIKRKREFRGEENFEVKEEEVEKKKSEGYNI
jgi:hypothetical protein